MWRTAFGKCLYQSEKLTVYQNPLFRWLEFNSRFLQTVINRYAPHKPSLSYIKPFIAAFKSRPGSCCMLGLGGGGVAHAVSTMQVPPSFTIVENSKEVVAIAYDYFMIDKFKADLHVQDAGYFVKTCSQTYQHLLIDLFTAESFPSHCASESFFADCKRLLKPEGILALNLANKEEHRTILKLVQKQFGPGTIIVPVPCSGNIIVYAINNSTNKILAEILKCKKLIWNQHWGWVGQF